MSHYKATIGRHSKTVSFDYYARLMTLSHGSYFMSDEGVSE